MTITKIPYTNLEYIKYVDNAARCYLNTLPEVDAKVYQIFLMHKKSLDALPLCRTLPTEFDVPAVILVYAKGQDMSLRREFANKTVDDGNYNETYGKICLALAGSSNEELAQYHLDPIERRDRRRFCCITGGALCAVAVISCVAVPIVITLVVVGVVAL